MESTTTEARERFYQRGLSSELKKMWHKIDRNEDGYVNCREVMLFLKSMGYDATKAEVEEMMWEVDENNDGRLNFKDFEEMFKRCSHDKAGTEPRQLYNVVLFALQDTESKGYVTVEQATVLMHLRYGRDSLDNDISAVFDPEIAADPNYKLSLIEFIHKMNKLVAKHAKTAGRR